MAAVLAFMTLVLALSQKQRKTPKFLAVTAFSMLLNMVAVLYTCLDFSGGRVSNKAFLLGVFA
jgi:hypothetical protein